MTARSSGIHFRPQKHILFSNSKLELSYARTYEGTNERTHTHTHLSLWCPCLGVWLVGGTWGLALRGKLYGLLAYFTLILFFFTKTNMKLVNGLLLTVLVAEVSSPTHTTHTHPPPCLHTIYTLPSTSVNRNLSIQLRSVFELVVLWVERSTNVQSKDNIVPFNKQYITLTLTHTIPL